MALIGLFACPSGTAADVRARWRELCEAMARAIRDELPALGAESGWVGAQDAEGRPISLTRWGDHA